MAHHVQRFQEYLKNPVGTFIVSREGATQIAQWLLTQLPLTSVEVTIKPTTDPLCDVLNFLDKQVNP